ncbi:MULTISPECIES: isopentenyl-diphosphate Delta-isomerase [Rhodococcus]|uniref:Isopentenyl-diphosphate Delta-isomerase n=1 Tax=Rhodococcus aetherivorans TaxID=191292 RepID=A0AA46NXS6_9NOCA|nr:MULTISPECIES: isopentenyl-diphosphate Delta-isomerase [Rhodococcus]NCL73785.1 Isopentenyl-diphosphate Delta-isomerase [Rhodococcus sp. YH1]AKE90770.1 isopentenyl-diphosphate delta-isomerase [Rhodococcus aetherivorans]ANZ24473.1 isopentenyl-diphosphate delta-isomerase [Rhodococcus sp. WB1]OLL16759.1 isopentenyl-diphosphate delta-isomerase [Rhodococcus sp. M8]UGQ43055.1 isopentenyl-diphosphate Delta-isomerase [Rhodococcus aetherivorans]
MTLVVLVDRDGREVGTAEKVAAHRPPAPLHRAFSAFLLDADDNVLLQRRSLDKYHFAGLWANSCCGHPLPGESVLDAAARRSWDELGVRPSDLQEVASVVYSAHDPDSSLMEHEFDHVVVGRVTTAPRPVPSEVAEVRFQSLAEVVREVEQTPQVFAPWMPHVLGAVLPALTR